MNKIIEFSSIQSDLQIKIQELINNGKLPQGSYTLIDGVMNFPIQKMISGDIYIGGPVIPCVAIVNNENGQISFHALKMLLPDLKY